jgi:hypothetical protein
MSDEKTPEHHNDRVARLSKERREKAMAEAFEKQLADKRALELEIKQRNAWRKQEQEREDRRKARIQAEENENERERRGAHMGVIQHAGGNETQTQSDFPAHIEAIKTVQSDGLKGKEIVRDLVRKKLKRGYIKKLFEDAWRETPDNLKLKRGQKAPS